MAHRYGPTAAFRADADNLRLAPMSGRRGHPSAAETSAALTILQQQTALPSAPFQSSSEF